MCGEWDSNPTPQGGGLVRYPLRYTADMATAEAVGLTMYIASRSPNSVTRGRGKMWGKRGSNPRPPSVEPVLFSLSQPTDIAEVQAGNVSMYVAPWSTITRSSPLFVSVA